MIQMADWRVTHFQKRLIKQVLNSGRLTYGDKTRELEEKFARIHGVNYALFTSSGTAALKIALHALKDKYGWKDGDEVLIPAVTFVATMNIVLMNNLTPVLVDVDPKTANMNPSDILKHITKRTRVIIPVHLLGQPADMDSIMRIARKHKLKVIEDSCETMFVNKVRGDIACFSTYLAHLLVTGIGGFITSNDEELATVMRSMMFHGRDESYLNIDDKSDVHKKFYFPRFGYSDRMTELEAALGLGDLQNWKKMIKKRQANAKYLYNRTNVGTTVEDFDNHAFMFYPIIVNRRDELAEYLDSWGIDSRLIMPLTTQPVAQPYVTGTYPGADFINRLGLLIPCHQYLTRQDLNFMIKKIGDFYG